MFWKKKQKYRCEEKAATKKKQKKSIRKKSNKKSSRQGDDFPKGQINMAEKEQ
ncbi:hypothetical protein [Vibrio hibernica]|uniref:hypothetical protein n=1 Tax=Vibrio hibernica TaxID=2587465 RepID=UPI001E58BF7D|nr:hypothetical protein [Vibrio hibernica]